MSEGGVTVCARRSGLKEKGTGYGTDDDTTSAGQFAESRQLPGVKRTTSTFGTFGRYTEIPLDQMTSEQRTGYDLEVKERGEVPGPHKI
jgi:hypothetical protein